MENEENFYIKHCQMYKDIKKDDNNLRVVLTTKNKQQFPYLPFSENIEDDKTKKIFKEIKESDKPFLLVTQKLDENNISEKYNEIGAVCKIQFVTNNEKNTNFICDVLYFAKITDLYLADNVEYAHIEPLVRKNMDTENVKILLENVKNLYFNYISYSNKELVPEYSEFIQLSTDSDVVVSALATIMDLSAKERYELVAETNEEERLTKLIVIINRMFSVATLNKHIDEKIREDNEKHQREMYIKEKIKRLNEEIGEEDEITQLENEIKKCNIPSKTEEYILKQLSKLKKTPTVSADYNILRNYIETIIELPWNKSTVDNTDVVHAKKVLDNEHFGLEKVKSRILEYIAVLHLNDKVNGQILCLVGAPGVGKTSIAKSVANALGRKFVKLTLGGVNDESEIRGHRKTYVGAMVGKIIHNIKLSGSNNPVFLLDEIDKLTTNNHGDPASALLEVLDPQQNASFRDNFLEVPFDLSKVVFIATANYANQIPAPLRDRMEIINVESYTAPEKVQIAKSYLLPKQLKENGISEDSLIVNDDVLYSIINNYTYEAGVRNLERIIAKICRQLAVKVVENPAMELPWVVTKDMLPIVLNEAPVINHGVRKNPEVGVGYGLGWSPYGGSILTIEGISLKGKGNLVITGNLKNVMKESCQIAYTVAKHYVLSNSEKTFDFSKYDLHINACEGGIQKDGPSAGVVLTLVMYSVLTNKKLSNKFALTGEISLTGQVYAIGGLREKLYACVQNNIPNVIVPLENEKDIKFIPKEITEKLNIYYVSNFQEVIDLVVIGDENENNKK